MNMQAMLRQAQNMQRDMLKAKEEIDKTEFTGTSSLVTAKVMGDKSISSIEFNIDDDFTIEDIDMLQDMVVVATDAGSSKKAYKYAKFFECPVAMIDKRRDGNNDQAIASTVIGEVKGKNAIIFDDEIDTAGSIVETER